MAAILPRHADWLLDELLAALPAIMLVGPRAVGKTTLAAARAGSALDLDVPATAAAARLDPDSAIAGLSEPVLVDEWQHVPEILSAIKRSIDHAPSPGRFLITGRGVIDLTEAQTWTVIATLSAALLGMITVVTTVLMRTISTQIGSVRNEMLGLRTEMLSGFDSLPGEARSAVSGPR